MDTIVRAIREGILCLDFPSSDHSYFAGNATKRLPRVSRLFQASLWSLLE